MSQEIILQLNLLLHLCMVQTLNVNTSLLNAYKDTKFYNLLSGLIILRYIFLFIYSYANINISILYLNNERIFPTTLILMFIIKACFDFVLMSIVMALSIVRSKEFFKYLKIKFSY